MEKVEVTVNGHIQDGSEYFDGFIREHLVCTHPDLELEEDDDVFDSYVESPDYAKDVASGYLGLINLIDGLNTFIHKSAFDGLRGWIVKLQKYINIIGGEDSKAHVNKDSEAYKKTILGRLDAIESFKDSTEKEETAKKLDMLIGWVEHNFIEKLPDTMFGQWIDWVIKNLQETMDEVSLLKGNLINSISTVEALKVEIDELKLVIGSLSKSQGLESPYKQRLVYNHTPKYEWEGHAFRSKQEMEVAIALDALGVVYGPNVGVRVTEGDDRKTREVDFMVYLDGHTGILECDSVEFHNAENDIERDRNFQRQGIYFIKRYTSKECLNPNWVAEDFIKSMRFFYAK